MRRAAFLEPARADLADILLHITRSSGHISVGRRFVHRIRERCTGIAELPGMLGVARAGLEADLRSVTEGNYVIFFRYAGDRLEIVRIIEGHRDLPAHWPSPA